MEGDDEVAISENGDDNLIRQHDAEVDTELMKERGEENVLRFLDSLDGYLTLMDSLNSTLRQGWFDLASARHSMGASRINSAMLDLKLHSAATSVQLTEQEVGSMASEPHFTLCKWASTDNGNGFSVDANSNEGKFHSSQLRHRGSEEKHSPKNGDLLTADDEVKKERTKSLSVFGTLVSPKLRSAQISFETALETLLQIANMRSSMLSSFDRIHKEFEVTKR